MTLMTGKGGRYRYYTCATKARKGKTACEGINIRTDQLDALVLEHFERQVLIPGPSKQDPRAVDDTIQEALCIPTTTAGLN